LAVEFELTVTDLRSFSVSGRHVYVCGSEQQGHFHCLVIYLLERPSDVDR